MGITTRKYPRDIGLTLPETNSSPLKIDPWTRRLLLETIIFRGYASFREGIYNGISQNRGPLMGTSVHPDQIPWSMAGHGLFWGLDLIKSHSYPSSSSLFDPPDLVDNGDNEEARGAW